MAEAIEYMDSISAEGYDPTRMSVMDGTQNNMLRLQLWSIGQCGVCLYCYFSPVHSDPEQ